VASYGTVQQQRRRLSVVFGSDFVFEKANELKKYRLIFRLFGRKMQDTEADKRAEIS
jgi:hypothetical protein